MAALLAVVVISGCTQEPSTPGGLPTPSPSVADPSALRAQRHQAGLPDCPAPASTPASGLPALELGCIDGSSTAPLNAVVRGTTVINFWAQWCGPCRREAPHLATVSKELAGQVYFLGIDQDDPEPSRAIAFAQQAGWNYPQFADPGALSRRPPLQVTGLPVTLVVSDRGTVVARHVGPVESAEQLRQLIAKADR